jgi:two-component system, OmpR family, KDP operon response regulator KdpE
MAGTRSLRKLLGRDLSEQSRKGVSSNRLIEIGDFRIDTLQRSVTLRGQQLPLTSQEFDVLVFLVGHPQQLVTPHTTLSTNWTNDRPHQTEFLKTLLSLRQKLDALGGGRQYLRTEPWVIYRFDPNSSAAA